VGGRGGGGGGGGGEEDVVRLEVAVDDAQGVEVRDAVGDLEEGAAHRRRDHAKRLVALRPVLSPLLLSLRELPHKDPAALLGPPASAPTLPHSLHRLFQPPHHVPQRAHAELQGQVDKVPALLPQKVPDHVGVPVALDQEADLPVRRRVEGSQHPLHGHGALVQLALEDDGPVAAEAQNLLHTDPESAHAQDPLGVGGRGGGGRVRGGEGGRGERAQEGGRR
jgi:hypothetical protein